MSSGVEMPRRIELDLQSSTPESPYGIITADCSGCHEMDDGVVVEQLDSDEELYRAGVFAVDTSKLYTNDEIVKRVLRLTESRYDSSRTDKSGYRPMLDAELTQRLHFAEGNRRNALAVSFLVGPSTPPSEVNITFGQVEVRQNYTYRDYSRLADEGGPFAAHARVASLIAKHLEADFTSDEVNSEEDIDPATRLPLRELSWARGASITQAFMVGANYLVARTMRDENALALYRVHTPDDDSDADFIDPDHAHYSRVPKPHEGLGLEVYTRVTSPLRRLEDFIMHGLLRARFKGQPIASRDERLVKLALQSLNHREARGALSTNPYTRSYRNEWTSESPASREAI